MSKKKKAAKKPIAYVIPSHLNNLLNNASEVERLVEIHTKIAGEGRGKRGGVEVLNKSAIVLLVACWESFIEDVASSAFNIILDKAKTPKAFPNKVLVLASKNLRENKDETKVWGLAGSGWKKILKKHREKILKKYIGTFNTPKTKNINALFLSLIGVKRISSTWYWPAMSVSKSTEKLDRLVEIRGEIAHEVKTTRSVRKSNTIDYTEFIKRLAAEVSNSLAWEINDTFGEYPWAIVEYYVEED